MNLNDNQISLILLACCMFTILLLYMPIRNTFGFFSTFNDYHDYKIEKYLTPNPYIRFTIIGVVLALMLFYITRLWPIAFKKEKKEIAKV